MQDEKLRLSLPKTRKLSRIPAVEVSLDEELEESGSSGFRSGPGSDSAHSGKLHFLVLL